VEGLVRRVVDVELLHFRDVALGEGFLVLDEIAVWRIDKAGY